MPLTHGQQMRFLYVEESTPGTTPTNPVFIRLSKEVQRVKFLLDRDLKESLDVEEFEPDSFFSARKLYGIEVDFNVYDVSRFLDFWERIATGQPRSYSIEISPNQDAAVVHYYSATGWRPKTAKLSGNVGEAYVASVVFEGGKIADPVTVAPPIGTGSREAKSAIVAALRHFASGAVTLDGLAWATLVGGLEVTCDHQSEPGYTTGGLDPVAAGARFGNRKIAGTTDISLDEGLSTFWSDTVALAVHTIEIPFGAAGQPKLTLSGVVFPRIEGEFGVDKKAAMGNRPFSAKSFTEGTV